jgi:putative FmdB family regulatory protein
MPIYEYECLHCGNITEEWQKISDPPLETCPHCHGRVKKLMSMNTFHLKGSGWYVTDYAKKNSGATSPPTKSDKKDTNSTETASSTNTKSSGKDE